MIGPCICCVSRCCKCSMFSLDYLFMDTLDAASVLFVSWGISLLVSFCFDFWMGQPHQFWSTFLFGGGWRNVFRCEVIMILKACGAGAIRNHLKMGPDEEVETRKTLCFCSTEKIHIQNIVCNFRFLRFMRLFRLGMV